MPSGTVVRVWQETPRLSGVSIDVDLSSLHTRPAQYVLAHVGPKAGGDGSESRVIPLAVATAPGDHPVELLFEANERPNIYPGAAIVLDGPKGRGFDIEGARGHDVLVFAVGSAMSAARPVLDMIAKQRGDFGRVTLYYGARTPEEHVYRSRDRLWAEANIDVHRATDMDWVQNVFRRHPVPVSHAMAFVVGMKQMELDVRAALAEAGLEAHRMTTNF